MVTLTAVHGDITEQDVDAIVNAANNRMRGGGGVDGAIHRAAGPALLRDCVARFPDGLATGDAGWTTAGELRAAWVIHTVGPNYTAGQRDRSLLESCYRRALQVAEELGALRIAFPLISAGVYGWPRADAISAAVETIAQTPTRVEDVRLVAFTDDVFQQIRAQILRTLPPASRPGTIGRLFDCGVTQGDCAQTRDSTRAEGTLPHQVDCGCWCQRPAARASRVSTRSRRRKSWARIRCVAQSGSHPTCQRNESLSSPA
jgi:O-acetyl-ADP-ribose deacetylase (regulator of RNase III)